MKRIMAIFWVVVLLCMLHVNAEEVATSGMCGENVKWSYSDGVLTISGNGYIADCEWDEHIKAITDVKIGEGITGISSECFRAHTLLVKVEFPTTLRSIEMEAFRDCKNLKAVILPEGITSIWPYAFRYCDDIETLEMPDKFYDNARREFGNTVWYKNLRDNAENGLVISHGRLLECTSEATKITVPDGVKVICDNAFYRSNIEEIILPDTVEKIGIEAFCNTNLKKINFPATLKMIGDRAFEGCEELAGIKLPKGVETIGEAAFKECAGITEIEIPETVKILGNSAFAYTGITEIYFPSLTELRVSENIFEYCTKLKKAVISDDMKELPDGLFKGCSALEEVTLPSALTQISDFMFFECESLTNIEIPETVKRMGDKAFCGCAALTEFKIPTGVTTINEELLSDCTGLKELTIPENVTLIGPRAFMNCTALENIEIPDTVLWIEGSAFENCKKLKAIELPPQIKLIQDRLFSGCELLSDITIPETVTHIGNGVFRDCKALNELHFPESVEDIGSNIVTGCDNIVLHIPPNVKYADQGTFNRAKGVLYARPESVVYGLAVESGWEVRDAYMPNVGDVVDSITESDIYVTLNGQLLPSYCVDGCTLILLRDLERYGFDVRFDEKMKTAYADFNPQKGVYDGEATYLPNTDVLYTDIRAVINGVEIEARNTNGYVAVEAERVGNYVPKISCVWQPKHRRLQMQAFEDMASYEDLVNSISERKGIEYIHGSSVFADTDNGRYDEFVEREYIDIDDYNGYIYPMRGLTMHQFLIVAGHAYFGRHSARPIPNAIKNTEEIPDYLPGYVARMYDKGIFIPDENGQVYLDGILTKAQMEYYLDILDKR